MMSITWDIHIPCLLIHPTISNKKNVHTMILRTLIFCLMSGKLHLSPLLRFITSVNYESNLRLSRTCIFTSSWHFTHSLLEWHSQQFIASILSYKICTSHKFTFLQHNILKELVKIISFYFLAEAFVSWPLQSDEKEVADIDW